MLKRRQFLQTTAVGASGLLLPRLVTAQSSAADNALQIPELLSGASESGRQHYRLNLQAAVTRFFQDLQTPTLGINGSYLGPTLRLKDGSDVSMHVHNALGETTTLHWHGLHVPASADGGPHQVIADGATWEPEFQVIQKAGTFWYHSHLVEKTGEQVYRGLAGMIIVDDEESAQLSLPSDYGVDDIPLVVQDRRFNQDGSFQYIRSHQDTMMGMTGDTILVNGTLSPYFVPTTSKVRFRLLNGSNARTYNFAFSDGRSFQQLGCDGGFLAQAVSMNRIELAPAERCEIVVDFSDGRPVDLLSLPMAADSPFQPRGMMRNMFTMNNERLHIMAIRPQSNLVMSEALPPQLTNVPDFEAVGIDRVRQFNLSMAMGMGMMRGGGGPGGGRGMGQQGSGSFFINGRAMDMSVINERIPVGSTEIWEITNDSMMMHPFHVHHGQFQVKERNGRPPHAHERAYKDTVKVGPGETVRIVMEFEHFADPDLAYMYHCHILEHEDDGMMGQFVVY
jgi:blue copper oxidase